MVKVIWQKTTSLPQTDSSIVFARWRQCAHIGATWRIWLNLSSFSQPESTTQMANRWFSCFCTALGRKSLYYTMGDPFPKIAPSRGGCGPLYNSWSLSHTEPTVQTASWLVQLFSHSEHSVSLYFTVGVPFPQNCPFPRGSGPPSNTIPWAYPSPQTKRHLHQFSCFCTYDRRVSLYFTMGRPFPPLKIAPSHGGIWTLI